MTQKKSKVLVTICNYNHSQYLEQAVRSIQHQSYSDLDICIVDDGSEDIEKVIDIVETFKKEDKRIRFINLEKNHGKWFALNKSIETSDAHICTAHDADDISLRDRISLQLASLMETKTAHNLCGFYHCWNEEDVLKHIEKVSDPEKVKLLGPKIVREIVLKGYQHPGINHYFTGEFETAGVSAMFVKDLWTSGIRFNPPDMGLRTLLSEDSDFNFRCTMLAGTSIVLEKPYLYRRNTSTNQEQM